MADINIQRKKSSPSPWLLILLVLLVVGAAAYFLLRHDAGPAAPISSPAPSPEAPLPDSTTGAETGPRPDASAAVADMSSADEPAATPAELTAFAASEASTPDYGRRGLQMLSAALGTLADRADFRDAAISTRRDDLTSATSRLEEEGTSLRPGFIAATLLLQAMQQKGYPELEGEVNQLTAQADALTGRTATAQDQAALQAYLTQAARLVKALNEPPTR